MKKQKVRIQSKKQVLSKVSTFIFGLAFATIVAGLVRNVINKTMTVKDVTTPIVVGVLFLVLLGITFLMHFGNGRKGPGMLLFSIIVINIYNSIEYIIAIANQQALTLTFLQFFLTLIPIITFTLAIVSRKYMKYLYNASIGAALMISYYAIQAFTGTGLINLFTSILSIAALSFFIASVMHYEE